MSRVTLITKTVCEQTSFLITALLACLLAEAKLQQAGDLNVLFNVILQNAAKMS